ncbi:hypothetical protein APS47_00865 [Leptospira kirschneri serovar Mozdok]|nr:hypothetical protein APS47_00865 [Leptospira kirschneri serovar Mozdok]
MIFLDFSSRCLNSVFLGFNRSIVVLPKVDSVSTCKLFQDRKIFKKRLKEFYQQFQKYFILRKRVFESIFKIIHKDADTS